MRRVILTFSGKVNVSGGSEIWSRIARVMKAAGANIETAGSTFVRMARAGGDDNLDSVSFSVSAFGAQVSPAVMDERLEDLGCAMYLKAILPQSRVTKMMQLLRTESPLQVYTVSSSAAQPARLAQASCNQEDPRTGTVHLFGVDRPGQLARITQLLSRFGASVMQLHVHNSMLERVPLGVASLAENRVRIVFDESTDVALLRTELQRVGQEVGYAVTCLTTDTQSGLRNTLPSYVLWKKAFAMAYLSTVAGRCSRGHARPSAPRARASATSRATQDSRCWRRRRCCRPRPPRGVEAASVAGHGRRSRRALQPPVAG